MKRKRKQLNVMNNNSVTEIWENYKKDNPETPEDYVAWAFGDSKEMADEHAELVLEGKKTATASSYVLYELENEPLPHVYGNIEIQKIATQKYIA